MLAVTDNIYQNTIPSVIEIIGSETNTIHWYVRKACSEAEESFLFDTRVIVNELLSNAVRHGNMLNKDKKVEIIVYRQKDKLYITVEDQGKGYDYDCILNYDINCEQKICDMKETGRGILLVKILSEKLIFNNKGNRITVVKSIE